MKLTKLKLQQIIKEELDEIMSEAPVRRRLKSLRQQKPPPAAAKPAAPAAEPAAAPPEAAAASEPPAQSNAVIPTLVGRIVGMKDKGDFLQGISAVALGKHPGTTIKMDDGQTAPITPEDAYEAIKQVAVSQVGQSPFIVALIEKAKADEGMMRLLFVMIQTSYGLVGRKSISGAGAKPPPKTPAKEEPYDASEKAMIKKMQQKNPKFAQVSQGEV